MANLVMVDLWKSATEEGFVTNEEIQQMEDIAAAMGVDLPAGIEEAAGVFNALRMESIDPATASGELLYDTLFDISELDGTKVHFYATLHGFPAGESYTPSGSKAFPTYDYEGSGEGVTLQNKKGISQWAGGGMLTGGVNLVGERGPEIIIN